MAIRRPRYCCGDFVRIKYSSLQYMQRFFLLYSSLIGVVMIDNNAFKFQDEKRKSRSRVIRVQRAPRTAVLAFMDC